MRLNRKTASGFIGKYSIYICLAIVLMLVLVCSRQEDGPAARHEDSQNDISLIATRLNRCSRLYSTQYQFQKIITHEDLQVLRFGNMSVDIPFSDRRIAIPMHAALKAYTDMALLSEKDVQKNDSLILIMLPEPQIEVTSCYVDYDRTKDHVSLFGKDYTPKELDSFQRQGLISIIASAQKSGIFEEARLATARVIVPILTGMGYRENNITIQFRKSQYSVRELESHISYRK